MSFNNKLTQETKDKWQNDPTNFVMGIFYYNKQDNRIFPAKISGLGWTTNFANPKSVLALLGVIVALVLIMIFVNK